MLCAVGLGIACLALLSFGQLDETSSLLDVGIRLALMGVGTGLFSSPNSSSLLGSVDPARMGVASGILASVRNLGMVLGTAIAGAVLTGRMASYAEGLAAQRIGDAQQIGLHSFVGGFQDAFLVAAAICSLGVLTSLAGGGGRAAGRREAAAKGPAREVTGG